MHCNFSITMQYFLPIRIVTDEIKNYAGQGFLFNWSLNNVCRFPLLHFPFTFISMCISYVLDFPVGPWLFFGDFCCELFSHSVTVSSVFNENL